MVEQGRITIDDKPVTAGTRVHDGAVVRVDGRQVTKEEEEIFLAFYKPRGSFARQRRRKMENRSRML